jgi:4-amino-4-deoxy-L-arabinose transferase-like glycosyltransferase
MMSERRWLCILLAVGLLVLLPGIAQLPLLDRDEPRFSRAAVEMMERGDWAVPWFNGNFRFDKPPLTYWLMMPWLAIFGETELAVRLPTVLSALACMGLIFSFAKRLGLRVEQAALAAGAWLTCLQVMIHGRVAVADMHLILMLIVTMRAFWELGHGGRTVKLLLQAKWFHVLWLSMGLGFLAKGPLALAVPLAALLLMLLLERIGKMSGEKIARRLLGLWAWALLPALLLVALWGIPALLATQGLFYEVGIGTHVVDRGLEGFNDRKVIPVIYYFLVLPIFFAPWTGALPGAVRTAWNPDWDSRYLAAWVLAPLLIFSGYATQLPHYILPAYPALILLVVKGWRSGSTKAKMILAFLPGVIFGVLAVVATWGALQSKTFDASLSGMLTGLALLGAGFCVASFSVGMGRAIPAFAAMVVAVVGFQWLAIHASQAHAVKRLIKTTGQDFSQPAAVGFGEPSLVWYGSTRWTFGKDFPENADLCVIYERRWRADGKTLAAIWKGEAPQAKNRGQTPMVTIPADARRIQGWSAADSSWVELCYWRKVPRH